MKREDENIIAAKISGAGTSADTKTNNDAEKNASAVYEGVVTHRRHVPHAHTFSYRIAQLYIDLDELDTIFRRHWLWSINRRNLAEWRRSDYLAPADMPLTESVRKKVCEQTGRMPTGPIRLLTHLRYGGFVFNPVSFYYCYADDITTLDCIVAEVTNTPWRERHAYVLPVEAAERKNNTLHWHFAKTFHVSPFMPMARNYDWYCNVPDENLRVHMKVCDGERTDFEATLALARRALDGKSLARVLWRYPLMTAQVIGAIHWQALRLWLKRNPVYDHPHKNAGIAHD